MVGRAGQVGKVGKVDDRRAAGCDRSLRGRAVEDGWCEAVDSWAGGLGQSRGSSCCGRGLLMGVGDGDHFFRCEVCREVSRVVSRDMP